MTKTPRMTQIEAMLADDPADAILGYMLCMEYVSAGDDAGAVTVFEEITAANRTFRRSTWPDKP